MELTCDKCGPLDGEALAIDIAYQPIFDLRAERVFAYEALVRGPRGEDATSVLAQIDERTQHRFDQRVRTLAIEKAAALGLVEAGAALTINIIPSAVIEPRQCLGPTIAAAAKVGLSHDRIIFECTETVRVDVAHAVRVAAAYKALGFRCALDDFGAGYHNLLVLADIETDIVKIDIGLIRGIDRSPSRRLIVEATVGLLRDLGREVVAEGIETAGELAAVRKLGVSLVQGFYLGRPSLSRLQHTPAHRRKGAAPPIARKCSMAPRRSSPTFATMLPPEPG